MTILTQSEIMNDAHGKKADVFYLGTGVGRCVVQRWIVYLSEYVTPPMEYPMIALQMAGKARIYRLGKNKELSADYVISGYMTIVPKNREIHWAVNGEVDVASFIFEDEGTCNRLQAAFETIKLGQAGRDNHIGVFYSSYLYNACDHLVRLLLSARESPDYFNAVLRGIELFVQRHLGESDPDVENVLASRTGLVSYALQRLSLGVKKQVRIEEIARELNISSSYLIRKFKNQVGITPHQFLLNKRISLAKSLLAVSDIDIASVAYESGFSSQSHMTLHFTKEVGMSPGKYRHFLETHDLKR
ncbi:MAG: AraC family transcriptional regulator [Porticoccaceae bacterium]|nr:AraC family transcriptional regulator [Porticoccaceae bacterium]